MRRGVQSMRFRGRHGCEVLVKYRQLSLYHLDIKCNKYGNSSNLRAHRICLLSLTPIAYQGGIWTFGLNSKDYEGKTIRINKGKTISMLILHYNRRKHYADMLSLLLIQRVLRSTVQIRRGNYTSRHHTCSSSCIFSSWLGEWSRALRKIHDYQDTSVQLPDPTHISWHFSQHTFR